MFAYAKQWQDTWTGRAHESFWRWTLDAWPGKKGKPSNTYALAYALVVAIKAHVDLDTFLERLSAELRTKAITGQTAERYTLASLQRRDAVRIATEMIMTPQHLHPATGRLPRVLTEHDRLPHPPVDIAALDRYSKRGDASREIVAAAGRVAAELPPIGPAFNPEDRRRR